MSVPRNDAAQTALAAGTLLTSLASVQSDLKTAYAAWVSAGGAGHGAPDDANVWRDQCKIFFAAAGGIPFSGL